MPREAATTERCLGARGVSIAATTSSYIPFCLTLFFMLLSPSYLVLLSYISSLLRFCIFEFTFIYFYLTFIYTVCYNPFPFPIVIPFSYLNYVNTFFLPLSFPFFLYYLPFPPFLFLFCFHLFSHFFSRFFFFFFFYFDFLFLYFPSLCIPSLVFSPLLSPLMNMDLPKWC